MNFLTSKRLITTAFVLLVLLNGTLLTMLWLQNTHRAEGMHGGHQFNHESIFARELSLSESQTINFGKLRQDHFLKIQPEMESIALLKKQLVEESLKDNPDSKTTEYLITSIGIHQKTIERELAAHFHQLAKLCTPEQRGRMKVLLENMATRRSHGDKGRWGHP
ncbi:MAG: periplasmic heavy metal sensor [Chlorobiaceae bacterium]|nr:periplasmic heavy metal sensor [Chlorobiaceae bacterium]